MRYFVFLSMLIISIVTLSGCGRNDDIDGLYVPDELVQNLEMEYVPLYGLTRELRIFVTDDVRTRLVREVASTFENANDGWVVNIISSYDVGDFEQIYELMRNGEIDLLDIRGLNYTALGEAGLLEDFLLLWDANDFYETLDSLLPVIRNYVHTSSAVSNGRVHQIPVAIGVWSLWPNQFNDYTLDYVGETPITWTWDQFASRFEYDMERQQVSYLFPFPATYLTYILLGYYHDNGGIDLSIVEEVLNVVYMLNRRNLIPSDWNEFAYSLLSFETFGGQVRDFSTYLTPQGRIYLFPEIEEASGVSAGLTTFAINTHTTNIQQRAAVDFVKIMLSPEFQNSLTLEWASPVINELSLEGVFANGGGGLIIDGVDTGMQVRNLSKDEVDLYNKQRQEFFNSISRVRTSRYITSFSSEIMEAAMRFYSNQMTMETTLEYFRDRFPME